jgi:DNA-binding NarL/FixJ family response regulator
MESSLSLMEDIMISVVTEVNDEALSSMDHFPPDVAVVDIDAPTDVGLTITRQLKQFLPDIGIISLASNYNDIEILQTLKAQASVCLTKEVSADRLVNTIRQVSRGEYPVDEIPVTCPILADQELIQFQELSRQGETKPLVSPLTPKEQEILDYVAQGFLNKRIATKLGVSEQTIKNHVTSILCKLNANVRTEAVIVAIKQGLVSI